MKITIELLEEKFEEYNELYFNDKLRKPKFGLLKSFRVYGQFSFFVYDTCISSRKLSISCYYDWEEEQLRNTMVHEMIHYKLAEERKDLNATHGKEFINMAQEMNEKYGLNVPLPPMIIGKQKLKVSDDAPKRSLARFFFTKKNKDGVSYA